MNLSGKIEKLLIFAYILPWPFAGMYLLWLTDSWWYLLSYLPPIILAGICGRSHKRNLFIIGNIGLFITSLFGTCCLNHMELMDSLGGTWHGYFVPFYSEQYLVVKFFIGIFYNLSHISVGKMP